MKCCFAFRTYKNEILLLSSNSLLKAKNRSFSFFFFNWDEIHPMQGLTATTTHGLTRKKAQKRLQATANLFRKNLQLKDPVNSGLKATTIIGQMKAFYRQ